MTQACKNCVAPKRHPGCHSTCPDYILDKQKKEELKEKIRREKLDTYEICEGVARLYKRHGRKKKAY